ncbi:MAG: hypothetical protein A2902_04820 [Elusimicrobia bacterium RIFCSPLOWO2_01_FULL_64_13]|nr:MAG: hypothetical protein A2902_04820 [Elusimicrobia bacterium RIFCSPLOWO2_01_FULL_64_13]
MTGKWILLCATASLAVSAAGAESPVLGLREAVRISLDNSPEAARAMEELGLARLAEPGLLAETDPEFSAGASLLDDRSPRAAPAFQGSFTKSRTYSAALSETLLTGTEAKLSFTNERVENPAIFRLLDPTVDSRLTFEVRQPLLKRFWGRPDKAKRSQFRAQVRSAERALDRVRERVASGTVQAYLRVRTALDELRIFEMEEEDSRALLKTYAEKRPYGLVEETDLLQARASVEARSIETELARSRLNLARDALKYAMGVEEAGGDLEDPPDAALPGTEEAALALAGSRRGDLSALRSEVERLEWGLKVSRLERLPDLSLVGSYAAAGLDRSAGPAMSDMGSFDHRVLSGGLFLNVPLGSRKEKIRIEEAEKRLAAARRDLETLARGLKLEVRRALEKKRESAGRLEAVDRLVQLEEEKLEAEKKDFARGRSNTDLVLRFMTDVRQARIRRLGAELDHRLASAELAEASGILLDWVEGGSRP